MRILGIDPGSILCGYGIVEKTGSKIELIEYGVINLKKLSPELPDRLKEIYQRLQRIIKTAKPDCAVLEETFYSKNPQSLIKLSHARGAAMVSCATAELPIHEYSPKEVKKSVTGNGNATKEQVAYMVQSILKIPETPEFFDATDALAVALTHCYKFNMPTKLKGGWKEFIEKNPNRVLGK